MPLEEVKMKTEYIVKFRDTSNELYHHGILGQKWGDRNGPPYPLGSGKHSISERSDISKSTRDELKSALYKSMNKYREEANYFGNKEEDSIASKFSYGSTKIKKDTVDQDGYHRRPAGVVDNYRVVEENSDGTQRILVTRDTPGYSSKISTFAVTIQKGNEIYVAGYSNEGLFKRGTADKAVEEILKAYNSDSVSSKKETKTSYPRKVTSSYALKDDDFVDELCKDPSIKKAFKYWTEIPRYASKEDEYKIAEKYGGYEKVNNDAINATERILSDRYGNSARGIIGVRNGIGTETRHLLDLVYWDRAYVEP